MCGHAARKGKMRMHTKFVGIPKENRPLGIPRHMTEANTEIDRKKKGRETVVWTDVSRYTDRRLALVSRSQINQLSG